MLLTLIIFFLINVTLAQYDANRIKKGKRIYHGINGAVYIVLLCLTYWIFNNWYLVAALCFERLLVFNPAVNLYRGLPFDYLPLNPKSIIDKAIKFVFKSGMIAYVFFLAAFILLICKIYLWK